MDGKYIPARDGLLVVFGSIFEWVLIGAVESNEVILIPATRRSLRIFYRWNVTRFVRRSFPNGVIVHRVAQDQVFEQNGLRRRQTQRSFRMGNRSGKRFEKIGVGRV